MLVNHEKHLDTPLDWRRCRLARRALRRRWWHRHGARFCARSGARATASRSDIHGGNRRDGTSRHGEQYAQRGVDPVENGVDRFPQRGGFFMVWQRLDEATLESRAHKNFRRGDDCGRAADAVEIIIFAKEKISDRA